MKGCSASLTIREMQIKTIMRHHFTLVRMAIINKSTKSKCLRGCGEKGTLVHCWWECRLVQPLWKTVWNFLKKLKMELPFDLSIPLLGLYPRNPETSIQKNLCTPMFIAAQQPSAGNSLNAHQQMSGSKNCYIYTMEFYTAEKQKELLPFVTAWMNWRILR